MEQSSRPEEEKSAFDDEASPIAKSKPSGLSAQEKQFIQRHCLDGIKAKWSDKARVKKEVAPIMPTFDQVKNEN